MCSICGTSSLEQVATARALEGERPDVVADLLDRHVEAADAVREVGEVGLGAGQQVLVLGRVQDDPVLDDEAAVVEPARVLGVARRAGADVAGEDAAKEGLGVLARDPVLVERARVEDAGRVADREVLELVGHLVAIGGQVAGPVAPELGLVERVRALVERGGPDHAVRGLCFVPSDGGRARYPLLDVCAISSYAAGVTAPPASRSG